MTNLNTKIAAKMSIPPYNFSWIVPEKIAGMAVPKELENLQYLVDAGVEHLISLSEERLPYNNVKDFPNLKWTLISVEEFEPPTLDDIHKFFRICVECHRKNKAIGVHCRQGLGRTGVMLACYLMVYQDLTPGNALTRDKTDETLVCGDV